MCTTIFTSLLLYQGYILEERVFIIHIGLPKMEFEPVLWYPPRLKVPPLKH